MILKLTCTVAPSPKVRLTPYVENLHDKVFKWKMVLVPSRLNSFVLGLSSIHEKLIPSKRSKFDQNFSIKPTIANRDNYPEAMTKEEVKETFLSLRSQKLTSQLLKIPQSFYKYLLKCLQFFTAQLLDAIMLIGTTDHQHTMRCSIFVAKFSILFGS
jgi:hypothetical protein